MWEWTMRSLGVILAIGLMANVSQAAELQCNRSQTQCVVDNHTNFTIGDRIGFFNAAGELVARGQVKSMRGDRRSVKVNHRHGPIAANHSLALLETKSGQSVAATYKIYKKPADFSVGAALGLATVGIGGGSPGTEFHGFAQWRKWRDLELFGRATYMAIEGEVSRTHDFIETQPISINGYGASGGVGYTLRKNKTVGFRGELGLGLMYVSADVGGDAALVEGHDFPTKVTNGFGPYSRMTLGAVLNMNKWHMQFDVTQSLIHQALASTLSAGLMFDLK